MKTKKNAGASEGLWSEENARILLAAAAVEAELSAESEQSLERELLVRSAGPYTASGASILMRRAMLGIAFYVVILLVSIHHGLYLRSQGPIGCDPETILEDRTPFYTPMIATPHRSGAHSVPRR